MEKGNDRHKPALRSIHAFGPQPGLADIGRDIGMSQHRALGYAGRAPGILLHGNILLGIDRHRSEFGCAAQKFAERHHPFGNLGLAGPGEFLALGGGEQQVLREGQGLSEWTQDDPLQTRAQGHLFGLLEQLRQIEGDDDVGVGIGKDLGQFVDGVERVAIDHDATGPQHGMIEIGVIWDIGQKQRHAGAFAHPELLLQCAAQLVDPSRQFAIACPPAHEIHGDQIGVGLADVEHALGHGRDVDRRRPLDPLGIMVDPRMVCRFEIGRRVQHFLPEKCLLRHNRFNENADASICSGTVSFLRRRFPGF